MLFFSQTSNEAVRSKLKIITADGNPNLDHLDVKQIGFADHNCQQKLTISHAAILPFPPLPSWGFCPTVPPAPSTSGTPPFVVLTLLSRLGGRWWREGVELNTSCQDVVIQDFGTTTNIHELHEWKIKNSPFLCIFGVLKCWVSIGCKFQIPLATS